MSDYACEDAFMATNARTYRLSKLGLAIRIIISALCANAGCHAATITVDSSSAGSGEGHCSLRDAVVSANTFSAAPGSTCVPGDGNADTIVFAPQVTDIVFSDVARGENSAILVEDTLTIDGGEGPSGGPGVTIERGSAVGTPDFRLIESDTPLTLRGLTVRNGHTGGNYLPGGGVYSSVSLTLVNCVITGNSTGGAAAFGGGAAVKLLTSDDTPLTLRLIHSTVSGNSTAGGYAYGGGIAAGYAYVINSVISNNRTTGPGGAGGGIVALGLQIEGTTVSNNQTTGDTSRGGGIFADKLYVDHLYLTAVPTTIITGNSTTGRAAPGGGIYTFNAQTLGMTLSGNRTTGSMSPGGGMYVNPQKGSLSLAASTISGNATTGTVSQGGGLFTQSATISNSTISGNSTASADSAGGGICATSVALNFATITLNQATHGPGLYLVHYASQDPTLTAIDSLLSANGTSDIASSIVGTILVQGDHDLVRTHGANITLPGDTLSCNPNLGPLAGNGGPTQTHALPAGSCAVDKGRTSTTFTTDQREGVFVRLFGTATDIGAFELQPMPDPIFANGFENPD